MALIIKNLHVRAKGRFILEDISFLLPERATLALMGPSGSGKTTLVKAILGLLEGFTILGHIHFEPPTSKNFAYIPQDLALWPHLTVQKTLEIAQKFAQESFFTSAELMDWCGLAQKTKTLPKNLSGGEKQRLAIARALVGSPQLLILDEPFSGLDVVSKAHIIKLIKDVQKKLDLILILISHDLKECLSIAQNIAILDEGKFFWQGESIKLSASSFPKHWNPLQVVL